MVFLSLLGSIRLIDPATATQQQTNDPLSSVCLSRAGRGAAWFVVACGILESIVFFGLAQGEQGEQHAIRFVFRLADSLLFVFRSLSGVQAIKRIPLSGMHLDASVDERKETMERQARVHQKKIISAYALTQIAFSLLSFS
jgi:hypothetical protein